MGEPASDFVDDWIKYGARDVESWIAHVENRLPALEDDPDLYTTSEVIYAVTSIFNRLAQIYYGTAKPLRADSEVIPWLDRLAGLPPKEAEALWIGVRNHIIHLGVVNSSFGFESRQDGMRTYVMVLPTGWESVEAPAEIGMYHAWSASLEDYPLDDGVSFTGRGVGFATTWLETEDQLMFPGSQPGELIATVAFFVDELLKLARHALAGTIAHIDEHRDSLRQGLLDLHEKIPFTLPEEEWPRDLRVEAGERVRIQKMRDVRKSPDQETSSRENPG